MQAISSSSSFPDSSPSSSSSSCSSSPSTAFTPDWDGIDVQNTPSLPHRYRRKMPNLGLNKHGSPLSSARTSACSTPSTATAAELGGRSPAALKLLKPSLKIAALEEIDFISMLDMTTPYADILATDSPAMNLSAPSSVSSDTLAVTTPDNALKLDGMANPPVTSTSLLGTEIMRADASHATEDAVLPSPPMSFSSLVSSSSSSSVSTEHSSYSATHSSDPAISSAVDTPRRSTKRKLTPASTRTETRPICGSVRPAGPAHLEYDYTVAHKTLSTAVGIAAYELFGFSVPIRNAETEAKRPGKDAIPVLRTHPLVRKAARAVDKADDALEAALARGETLQNTPIPEEWRWGSDYLRPYEWAQLEPEPVKETIGRRIRMRIDQLQPSEPRTRAQKRKAHKVEADDVVVKNEELEMDLREEIVALSPACASSPSTTTPDTNAATTVPESDSLATSSSVSDLPMSSSFVAPTTSESSLPSSPEKRKRGRPRKHNPKPSSSQTQTTAVPTSSPNPSVPNSPTHTESLPSSPVKRRRGRPYKCPSPPALPSSSPSKSSAVTATPAPAWPRSKRRRVVSSDLEFL